jgi:hypothetical protein
MRMHNYDSYSYHPYFISSKARIVLRVSISQVRAEMEGHLRSMPMIKHDQPLVPIPPVVRGMRLYTLEYYHLIPVIKRLHGTGSCGDGRGPFKA